MKMVILVTYLHKLCKSDQSRSNIVVRQALTARAIMASSSGKPAGSSSKWSCETLREGYQNILAELENAEKDALKHIAETRPNSS